MNRPKGERERVVERERKSQMRENCPKGKNARKSEQSERGSECKLAPWLAQLRG